MSTATAAPDTATATLIRRQRELLAILASQDRTDLDEYVDWDIVVQWADTSVSPRIATYTVFNLLNGDVALPHGANAEYRVVVSGPLGSVTSLLGERCVVTMWRRDTAGWHATKMQVLPTSPAPRLESIADSASPLLCHPSDNLTAALVRGVGEQ